MSSAGDELNVAISPVRTPHLQHRRSPQPGATSSFLLHVQERRALCPLTSSPASSVSPSPGSCGPLVSAAFPVCCPPKPPHLNSAPQWQGGSVRTWPQVSSFFAFGLFPAEPGATPQVLGSCSLWIELGLHLPAVPKQPAGP